MKYPRKQIADKFLVFLMANCHFGILLCVLFFSFLSVISSVVSESWAVLTLRLSGWMIDLQVKRLCVGPLYHHNIVPRPLVGFSQCVSAPVRPVNLAPVHGDGERVRQVFVSPQHLDQAGTIVSSGVDGIRPRKGFSRPSVIVLKTDPLNAALKSQRFR